jgi:hypothetical protein
VAQIEIISEQETAGGWDCVVQILDDRDGGLTSHHVRLAWADYNLWSPDGSDAPNAVVEAVITFFLERMDVREVPAKFDASMLRRKFPDADARIPTLIGR